jgi:carboxyl-terminal processing protease
MVIQRFFGDLLNHLDPYSRYASPQDAESEANRRNGRAGIGIELGQGPTGFVVRAVTQGSPAASAGIRPGDRLTEIDEQPLDGADLIAARALLAGPEDTRVILTLRGSGLRKVVLTRTILTQQSVFAQRRGPLLVLRISGFVHDTAARLAAELGRIGAMPGLRAVVIDLRGNRGGLLRQQIAGD